MFTKHSDKNQAKRSLTFPPLYRLISTPANKPQARIEAAGGFVSPPPEPGLSSRVWLDAEMTQIGLAMARSIGDHAVKSIGVVAEPEVTKHTIKVGTQCAPFVVMGFDLGISVSIA